MRRKPKPPKFGELYYLSGGEFLKEEAPNRADSCVYFYSSRYNHAGYESLHESGHIVSKHIGPVLVLETLDFYNHYWRSDVWCKPEDWDKYIFDIKNTLKVQSYGTKVLKNFEETKNIFTFTQCLRKGEVIYVQSEFIRFDLLTQKNIDYWTNNEPT